MKISLLSLGIFCSMFFITQDVDAMKRQQQQKTQSPKATKHQTMNSKKGDHFKGNEIDELDNSIDLSQIMGEYLKNIKPLKIRMMFIQAENHFKLNELDKAFPIYEKIVSETNDPIALFRLGEIYEKKAEENHNFLTKSYDFFKLSLENGFTMAIPKLLEIGECLNQLAKEAQSNPMSMEVQQMYL